MRRLFPVLMACVLALALCACAASQRPHTVELHGTVYTVDRDAGTIHDGTHTYHFAGSKDVAGYSFEITYPNGSTYWWTRNGYASHGGWSDDYSDSAYVPGDKLCEVLETSTPEVRDLRYISLLLLLLGVGAVNAAFPRQMWYLRHGWRFKNAEPSDAALEFNRVIGILSVAVAVVLFFYLYIF